MSTASESSASAVCQLPALDKIYEQYGGRGPEAEELQQWLSKPGSRVAAVVAGGGMGKTCLAVDVAWRLWRAHQANSGVLYVDCRGAFSREALLLKLKAAAGVTDQGGGGGTESLTAALAKMCSADPLGGALLVLLDNAEDPAAADGGAALAEVLAVALMAHSRVQLLVTSRVAVAVQHMPPPHTHRIRPLSQAVAGELVLQVARGVLTAGEAKEVAAACGCVPLALRLVAEALVAGRMTLEDVQQAVASRAEAAPGAPEAGSDGTREAKSDLDRTIMFVDMVLRSLPPKEQELAMQVSAFSGAITASAAAALLGLDSSSEHEVRAQLASLHRYSVLTQHGDDSFAMHSHVRDVARGLLAEAPQQLQRGLRERFARYAAGLLARWQRLHADNALRLMVTEVAELWADVEQFLADATGIDGGTSGARPLLPGSPLSLTPQLLQETGLVASLGHGDFLYAIGNAWMSPRYLALTQRLVDVTAEEAALQQREQQQEPPSDRSHRLAHAAALLVRCEALMYTGEYVESEGLAARAVELYGGLLGRDSLECAGALHLRASCLQGQGRGEEALLLYREALPTWQQLLGPSHSKTTGTLTHMAMLLSMEGKHAEAEGLYRQVLDAQQQTVGPTHNMTAQAVSNLAGCLHELGRLAEAEALYRQALAVYRETVGPRHRQVAFTLAGLAAVQREQGELDGAEGLYREAVEVCRGAMGPQHPHTKMTVGTLRELLVERGKQGEAEELEI